MTTTAYDGAAGAPPSWHDDALRLGASLDHVAAALVVGRDGEAAAWAALGAARAQSARRRVAVADLVGDAVALATAGEGDEPVGISDSFFYGVTLNKIARPVDASGNLFVLPSGSEPVAVAEVLSSDRWRRLVAGFREAGALLLLAARADAPGLDMLATRVDGLVVVGDLGGLLPDAPAPLMVIPAPTTRRVRTAVRTSGASDAVAGSAHTAAPARPPAPTAEPIAPASTALQDDPRFVGDVARTTAPPAPAAPTSARPAVATPRHPAMPIAAESEPRSRRRLALTVGVAATALAGALIWSRVSTRANGPATASGAAAVPAESASVGRPPAASAVRDSASGVPDAPSATAGDLSAALTVRNLGDSSRAAAYALHLVSANTAEGAALPPGLDPAALPEPALTPQLENGAPWWRLLVGAYATRQRAESALVALQQRGALGAGSGAIVRAPYALLVAERLPAAEAPARVEALARRGVPTYPLSRGDGTVALYAGAFERPGDAAYLAQALQAAGVSPALVYRTVGPAAGGSP